MLLEVCPHDSDRACHLSLTQKRIDTKSIEALTSFLRTLPAESKVDALVRHFECSLQARC